MKRRWWMRGERPYVLLAVLAYIAWVILVLLTEC